MVNILTKLSRMNERGWTLKPYKSWDSKKPCPPRLVVNVYKGCSYAHKYCYISGRGNAQKGFREHLIKRIKKAQDLDLKNIPVIVSSSTDPFQPIEREKRDSLFALETLLSKDYSVLIMTRNPKMLLEKEYKRIIQSPNMYLDVSIPSIYENHKQSVFYSPLASKLEQTFEAVSKLSHKGKDIRIKIEPVIPSTTQIKGQTKEEIKKIVKYAKEAGAKKIISKTMRLNNGIPKHIYNSLIKYYKENGKEERHGSTTNLILKPSLRKKLLQPVYDACLEHKISFCACVDADVFSEKTENCSLGGFENEKN